jgi:hypothetical protein
MAAAPGLFRSGQSKGLPDMCENFKKPFMATAKYGLWISGAIWCLVLGLLVVHNQMNFVRKSSSLLQRPVVQILEDPVYDFNGATAVVAKFPDEFYQPSALDLQGIETKGSFTARSSGQSAVKYVSVHGILNHPIQCDITGYRILTGAFAG